MAYCCRRTSWTNGRFSSCWTGRGPSCDAHRAARQQPEELATFVLATLSSEFALDATSAAPPAAAAAAASAKLQAYHSSTRLASHTLGAARSPVSRREALIEASESLEKMHQHELNDTRQLLSDLDRLARHERHKPLPSQRTFACMAPIRPLLSRLGRRGTLSTNLRPRFCSSGL